MFESYVKYSDYTEFMDGFEDLIPENEFNKFAVQATLTIDNFTYRRIDETILKKYEFDIKYTAIRLIIYFYEKYAMSGLFEMSDEINQMSAGKVSLSAGVTRGVAVAVSENPEYNIVRANLFMTGLLNAGFNSRCNN
ncbi:MAG: hypothetical protein FWD71_21680 [Oscillospiraceae bacterium]|nr:hypothetical protein [Oscillospiraceae bacterium]